MEEPKNSPWSMNTTVFQNRSLFFKTLMGSVIDRISVSMPCQIISYDRDTHVATVQPMLNYKVKGCNDSVCAPMRIEILRLMAGDFLIDFPIKNGDTGWVFAVDKDCYAVKELSKPALPAGSQINCYKTGFWIPDQWGNNQKLGISSIDEGRLVIMHKSGNQKIAIGVDDIEIKGTIKVTGNVTIDGKLDVSGKITETGAGVTLSTHTHKENGVAGMPETQSPTAGT